MSGVRIRRYAAGMANPLLEPWRPSLALYHRLGESGILEEFDANDIELLDGVITPMSPKGPAHEHVKSFISYLLMRTAPETHRAWIDAPITLGEGWEPEPDFALVPAPDPGTIPTTADLVGEIAVSSLAKDRGVKGPADARFGIPEFWLIIPEQRRVEVYRHAVDGEYEVMLTFESGSVRSTAVEGVVLDVDALWRDALGS